MKRHPCSGGCPAPLAWPLLLLCGLLLAGCAGSAPPAATPPAAPTPPVAALPRVQEMPAPAAAPDSEALEEANIFFAPGATTVDAAGEAKLRRHADRLKADRKGTVTLVGHTGSTGSRSLNLATSDQRVAAVSKLLRSFGVWARQIRPHSVIRENLPADCGDPGCWRLAHRVELRLSR